jgi:hypothetical protein
VSADKLDEIARRVTTYPVGQDERWLSNLHGQVRAALDEAVAEERKAMREIVQEAFDHPNEGWPAKLERQILAALAAREAKP